MKSNELKQFAKSVFGDLSRVHDEVRGHVATLELESTGGALEIPALSTVHPGAHGTGHAPPSGELLDMLDLGLRGLDRVDGQQDFDEGEDVGLEAIILLYGRPALLVQDDDFTAPPAEWQKLEDHRAEIQGAIKAVGRVELQNHHTYPWVGTGFLVGPELLMTNRHVGATFLEEKGGAWSFMPGVTASVDYKEEFQRDVRSEFVLPEFLGFHPHYDMALFRVAPTGDAGQALPTPLTVAGEEPAATRDLDVFVVGYPAWDGRRNDRIEMLRIFENTFNVKRLQPGKNTGLSAGGQPILGHDCSTLGGNSGSCVVDLDTGKVIGLHFGGRYMIGNSSVPLWRLTDDPFLRDNGVVFG